MGGDKKALFESKVARPVEGDDGMRTGGDFVNQVGDGARLRTQRGGAADCRQFIAYLPGSFDYPLLR